MVCVEFSNWQSGFKKVAFNRLLRERTGMSVTDAKRIVDKLLTDNRVQLTVESAEIANLLRADCIELGIGGIRFGGVAQIESSHTGSH